jgi:hypothetical protein
MVLNTRLKISIFAVAVASIFFAQISSKAAQRKSGSALADKKVVVTSAKKNRAPTRIIIQKRSYLDPGTETFPGERGDYDYAQTPTQHPSSVLDNTIFGGNMTPLPGPFTLPSKRNPWLQY